MVLSKIYFVPSESEHSPPPYSDVQDELARLGECNFTVICGDCKFAMHKEMWPFESNHWMMEENEEDEENSMKVPRADPRTLSQWIQWTYTERYSIQRQKEVTTDLKALCESAFDVPDGAASSNATSEPGVPTDVEQHAMVLAMATFWGPMLLENLAARRFKEHWTNNWDSSAFVRMATKASTMYATYNLGMTIRKLAIEHKDQLQSPELDGLYREFANEVFTRAWPNMQLDFDRVNDEYTDRLEELEMKDQSYVVLKVTGGCTEKMQANSIGQQEGTSTELNSEPASQGTGNEASDQNSGEMAHDDGAKLV